MKLQMNLFFGPIIKNGHERGFLICGLCIFSFLDLCIFSFPALTKMVTNGVLTKHSYLYLSLGMFGEPNF